MRVHIQNPWWCVRNPSPCRAGMGGFMRLFSQSSLRGGFQTCATKGRRGVDGTWEQTPKAERPPHTRSHIYLHTHEITKCKNPHAATATVLENTHSPNGLAWVFGCCLLVLSFQPFPSGALFTPAPRCLQTLQLHCVLREPFPGHPRKHLLCPGLPLPVLSCEASLGI